MLESKEVTLVEQETLTINKEELQSVEEEEAWRGGQCGGFAFGHMEMFGRGGSRFGDILEKIGGLVPIFIKDKGELWKLQRKKADESHY